MFLCLNLIAFSSLESKAFSVSVNPVLVTPTLFIVLGPLPRSDGSIVGVLMSTGALAVGASSSSGSPKGLNNSGKNSKDKGATESMFLIALITGAAIV